MFVIISHVIGVYSVFPVRAIDALLRCLHPFTSPYQPHPAVNVHYLHICGVPAVTSVAEVCQILQFGFCGCVLQIFLSICQLSSVSASNRWRAADDEGRGGKGRGEEEREVLRVSCVSWLTRMAERIDADDYAVDGDLRAAVLWGDVGCPRSCSRV